MLSFVIVSFAAILTHATSQSLDGSTCRKIQRPKTEHVPSYLRSWEEPYPEYDPEFWTVPCTDPHCDPTLPYDLSFNKKLNGFDRRRARACGKRQIYKIGSDGYPLNPAGRTGLIGRGLLKHWGPNHLVKVALVRTDMDERRILLQVTKGHMAMPEKFVNSMDDPWYDDETMEKIVEYLTKATGHEEEAMKVIEKAQKKSVKSMSGSMPSDLNTDHAWIEMHLRVVDCKKSKDYCDAVAEVLSKRSFKWTNVNETFPTKHFAMQSDSSAEKSTEKEEKLYSVYCQAIKREKLQQLFKVSTVSAIGTVAGIGTIVAGVLSGGLFAIILFGVGVPILLTCDLLFGLSLYSYLKCE